MFARLEVRCLVLGGWLLAVSGCQTPPGESAATSPVEAEATPRVEAVETSVAAPLAVPLDALPVGSHWALVASNAAGLNRVEASAIRLSVQADRLSGDSSCNRFSAGYQMLDGRLSVGPAMATKRGCQSPAGEIEQALFAVLPTLVSASMHGNDLILHGSSDVSLHFTPAAPTAD
ncbi:MAG: META domain-containing protein [Pseudomarimonas sp.]